MVDRDQMFREGMARGWGYNRTMRFIEEYERTVNYPGYCAYCGAKDHATSQCQKKEDALGETGTYPGK